ncbi:MAG: PDZ domain-containing protein [Verrucomicrobiota bacterium]
MNTKSIATITVIALLPIAGIAQTPPTPPAPPAPPAPRALMPDRHEHDHDRGPKIPVTFLGVETSSVPGVVSEQLGLAKGFGLVVDYVVKDGPAAAAGIQQNDILKMLNDQILMEPSQLRKLLQSFSEGTKVTLTVLRKGQEQKITVTLAKKEVPQRNAWFPGFNHDRNWNFEGMGDFGDLGEKMQNLKEQLKDQLGDTNGVIHDAVMSAQEEVKRARDESREEARRARDEARQAAREIRVMNRDNGALKSTRIDLGKAQIVFSDEKGEIKLETVDGKKVFTAKDPQGKLLFSGPVETKEELDKLPADVRERFDKLQKSDLPSVAPRDADDDEDTDDASNDGDEGDESAEPSFNQVSSRPRGNTMSMLVTL